MQAYHNKKEIKKEYLERVEAHALADEIIRGQYWERGKGCAVGCTIHSDSHLAYETELGIPLMLARLEDRIFEGMPLAEAKQFPLKFLSAIPVGADLSGVWNRFALWLLVDAEHGVVRFATTDNVKKSILAVAQAFRDTIGGTVVSKEDWQSLRINANASAANASAANASAAYAAAYAGAAAYAAAANASAYASYAYGAYAAKEQAFSHQAKKLLELLASAPVPGDVELMKGK